MNVRQLELFEVESDRKLELLKKEIAFQLAMNPMWNIRLDQIQMLAEYFKLIEKQVLDMYDIVRNEYCVKYNLYIENTKVDDQIDD